MAELKLDSGQFTASELGKRYNDFFAPAFEILVNGSKLASEIMITNIRVESSLEGTADSFLFHVTNAFDINTNDFLWINDVFVLGKAVEIKLGYETELISVFQGYITSVTVEFSGDEAPGLLIRGLDMSYLMMKGSKSKSWSKKKYSDIVKDIAGTYGMKTKIDDTTTLYSTVSQNQVDDYHFIQYLAELVHYDFFVVGKTVYFRKPLTEMTPVVDLQYGSMLRSLSIDMNIADQITEVTVRGWDNKELKVVEASATTVTKLGSNSKTGKDILKAQGTYKEHVYTNIDSQEEAKTHAEAVLNKRSMKLISGQGECVGIPEIRAGRYLKLSGIGEKLSQPYYIMATAHLLNENGYVTRFQLGGNAV
ncbi:phage late control D family protein [Paenibacillus agricola]|uniref:Phage late control D family protein n=1 Tax=Paenibacillus agricola TaxID=2716264 RepID=A0ABX0JB15_9BACL|nr:phage late control D family protein [Paenibacillus agricola]NHN32419.1 phage late control D family protein [Paenibacillus agricola]